MTDAIPSTMSAVTFATTGGPDVLQLTTVPTPEPGEGEVLIKVEAAALNWADMLERNGYEDEVHASQAAWAARDAEASIAAISDEMVRAAQCIGSLDEVREQLKERAAVVDIQMLYMPHTDDPREVGRWFEALMK